MSGKICRVCWRTHTVEVVEDLVHSYNFVVELVVAVGGGQERVAVRYEHVEQVHYLDDKTQIKSDTHAPTETIQQKKNKLKEET